VPLVALQSRFEDDPLAPVAALQAQPDIVVKPLDAVRGARPWFSGATVLGDGSPALIVDVGRVA